jgi:hypothetical protein
MEEDLPPLDGRPRFSFKRPLNKPGTDSAEHQTYKLDGRQRQVALAGASASKIHLRMRLFLDFSGVQI